MDENENVRVLRILCIHGFRQHPIQFKGRTRAFQKRLRQYMNRTTHGKVTCELCFDAFGPFELPWYCSSDSNDLVLESQKRPRLGWLLTEAQYYHKKRGDMDDDQYVHQIHGWDESVSVLDELLEKGRYDCILGFSQGAAVAACLSARECFRKESSRFTCCIIVSGYRIPMMREKYGKGHVDMPSMHIFGDPAKETQIPTIESQALADVFNTECRTILQTSDGHMVPSSRDNVGCIGSFLLQHCWQSVLPAITSST